MPRVCVRTWMGGGVHLCELICLRPEYTESKSGHTARVQFGTLIVVHVYVYVTTCVSAL